MRESEARALVARLASAFPSVDLPESSVVTYSRFLLPFHPEVVEEALDRVIVGWRSWKMPPLALILYEIRVVQEDRSMERGLPEGKPSEEDRARGLALVRNWLGRGSRGEADGGSPADIAPAPRPTGEES